MIPCYKHKMEMREAIEAKGLGHLISKSKLQSMKRVYKELNEEYAIKDPVIHAWAAVIHYVIAHIGINKIFELDELGNPRCPLCEVKKHGGLGSDQEWIESAADGQVEEAREAGLLNEN